ncbi:MAG: DUF4383 domain-containing protein [Protaetiibacter sp.]
MTPNRIAAIAGAALFAIVGGWGLVAALSPADPTLGPLIAGVFGTSVPLAVLQLVLALLLATAGAGGERLARPVNVAVGSLLLALGMFGLFAVGTPANVFGLNGADNALHFAASSGLLATGLGAARRTSDARQG